jgi:hypothetical protein
MWAHGPKSSINFSFYILIPQAHGVHSPADDMILENTLVELVQNIGREALENVAVWKVSPEWIDCPKSLAFEFLGL